MSRRPGIHLNHLFQVYLFKIHVYTRAPCQRSSKAECWNAVPETGTTGA
jgi:hypothetical protein